MRDRRLQGKHTLTIDQQIPIETNLAMKKPCGFTVSVEQPRRLNKINSLRVIHPSCLSVERIRSRSGLFMPMTTSFNRGQTGVLSHLSFVFLLQLHLYENHKDTLCCDSSNTSRQRFSSGQMKSCLRWTTRTSDPVISVNRLTQLISVSVLNGQQNSHAFE